MREFLQTVKGNRYDKSAVVYDMILKTEEHLKAWKYFWENADYIDSSEEKQVTAFFTAEQIQKYESEYSELVDALLNKLVKRHCEKEEFYNELWESIMETDVNFEGKEEKIYAMARVWADARIPYFQIKNDIKIKMSNEEFSDIIKKNRKLLQEIIFILNCQYDQKTELSSVLLSVLERCNRGKEKAVAMAVILDLSEKKAMYNLLKDQ